MIRITIKVKNDHRSMSESFEAEELFLSPDDPTLKKWIEKVMQDFNDPVEDVIVKTKMDL